jgi:hypothetical protein
MVSARATQLCQTIDLQIIPERFFALYHRGKVGITRATPAQAKTCALVNSYLAEERLGCSCRERTVLLDSPSRRLFPAAATSRKDCRTTI